MWQSGLVDGQLCCNLSGVYSGIALVICAWLLRGYRVFNWGWHVPHLGQERSYQPVEPVECVMGRCSEHEYCLSIETLPVTILTGLRDEIVLGDAYPFGEESVDLRAEQKNKCEEVEVK